MEFNWIKQNWIISMFIYPFNMSLEIDRSIYMRRVVLLSNFTSSTEMQGLNHAYFTILVYLGSNEHFIVRHALFPIAVNSTLHLGAHTQTLLWFTSVPTLSLSLQVAWTQPHQTEQNLTPLQLCKGILEGSYSLVCPTVYRQHSSAVRYDTLGIFISWLVALSPGQMLRMEQHEVQKESRSLWTRSTFS